jgi:hypothetical protein
MTLLENPDPGQPEDFRLHPFNLSFRTPLAFFQNFQSAIFYLLTAKITSLT